MAKRPPQPELGAIIEVDDVDGFRLAAVTGFIGRKKLVVVTEDGAERRAPANAVTWTSDESVGADDGLAGIAEVLERLDDEISRRQQAIDIALLWSKCADQGARPPEDLAKLVFDEPDARDELAVLRTLRQDHVYFRERKRGWEARPRDTVERLLAEAEARRVEAEQRARWVERVVEYLQAPRGTQPNHPMEEPQFEERLQQLVGYAVYGDQAEGSRRCDRLLDDIEDALGHRLRGTGSLRAFWLLVKLGVWDEHEDIGVRRFQLERNTVEAERESAEILSRAWEPDDSRRDLTDLWTCTIDDPSSRDLDDALSIEPVRGGGWLLGVHIADPGEWAPIDGELDQYARYASTSLYLPTGVVPMFPAAITEGRMSLTQGERRPAVSTLFRFSSSLAVESVEVVTSVIEVDRRLSYDEVDEALVGAPTDLPVDALQALRHIADEFHIQRQQGGAVDIKLPETRLVVDTTPDVPTAEVKFFTDSAARELIGELMIASNVAVANFCRDNAIPVPYRGQEDPDGDLYDDEIMMIPDGPAREVARLKRMRKGTVGTVPERHAGLGVDLYVQSTSPIRRYTDLVVQRQLKAHLAGVRLPYSERQLDELLSDVGRATYVARELERESNDYWIIWALGRVREPLEAVVVDIRSDTRAFVFLTDWAYRAICSVKSEVELGDRVFVDVTRADPRKGLLSLREA